MSLDTSPFLGGMVNVYKLIMQFTWYARQDRPLHLRQQQKAAWSLELDIVQEQAKTYFDLLAADVAELYHSKFMLHIYALRIMLEKIADHNLSTSDPTIWSYVKQAQLMFSQSPNRERNNPALMWPIIILLCACHEEDTFQYFVEIIREINENFDEGHMRRLQKVLEKIGKERKCGRSGLDLLLQRKGIFAENDQTEAPCRR